MSGRARVFWPAAMLALAALAVASVALGTVRLGMGDVWGALAGRGDATTVAIVRSLRGPRLAMGLLVGAGLGLSGATLQGALRNALAEPYFLGVSGGAAVGAVVAVSLGLASPALVPLAAFGGAAAAVVLVLGVSRAVARRPDTRVLLMAGLVVGAFANAAIMVALASASPNTVRGAVWWMMGSLGDADWAQAAWLAVYVLPVATALMLWARELDALALGEEPAAALGVDVARAARRFYLASALLAAATVAAAGLVGFVGLVVPHIARAAGLRGHRAVLGGAALVGAGLVVAADLAARTLRPPTELPLGAVTALVGVPFFLVQLRRAAA